MDINKRFSVHHIGGRFGHRAFPVISKFEQDVVNVLYDADGDCLAQIEEIYRRYKSELHVLPYCLGHACELASFNINYDPYTSSLKDLNPAYGSFYLFNRQYQDYIFSETIRTMEKRDVNMVTLDHLFQSRTLSVPPPDFLSLDTQGSEYEILQGAEQTLKLSVLALVIEVEFHQIYKDQKLFGDISKLLSQQGFHFVRFEGLSEMSLFRAPVGLRGEGFHTHTNALFLRQPDDLEMQNDEVRRYLMLQKLAFIAIVFNQFEYGLECLRRSRSLAIRHPVLEEELREFAYYKFLRDLENKVLQMPAVFPKSFASKYTFEASRSRFDRLNMTGIPERKAGSLDKIKQWLRRFPILFWFLRFIKVNSYGRLRVIMERASVAVNSRLFFKTSPVEKVLISYGLKSQAEILRKMRILHERFVE